MTLRARLSLTIAAIAILLVLPAAYGVTQLTRLRDLAQEQRIRHGAAYIALGRFQSSLTELMRLATEHFIQPTAEKRAAMFTTLQNARDQVDQLEMLGYRVPARAVSEQVGRLGVTTRRIDLLVVSERMDEAGEQVDSVRNIITGLDPLIAQIAAEIDRGSQRDLDTARTISARAQTTALAALLVCVALALLFGAWITRALTHPIIRLRNAMAVVAGGDFTVPRDLAYGRKDEIGSASRSFRAMTHRLSDLDRLKAEFLSFATHELRTPLNVVSGYADLLKEGAYGPVSNDQLEAIDAIRDQTRIIAQLVNQLLDIGRLEAGGLRIQIRDVSSAELFQRVEKAFVPLAQQKDVTLDLAIDDSVPETIAVDADRIADQVLGNLLSNALKFTPEGGHVRVHATQLESALVIEVSDTGPGIPPDKLPQIFDRYYQVDDEARRRGAGLGLSIARDIVRAHGGTIHAESGIGAGTTFRVMLPIGRSQYSAPAAEPAGVD